MSAFPVLFYFFLYSFFGWIMDTACRSLEVRAFTVGSFFPMPLCPIYGFGTLLILLIHSRFPSMPVLAQGVLFGILLSAMEYATGIFVLEVFHRRLWNYTGGLINLNNFTNLDHAVIWGVLSVLLIRYVQPALERLTKLPIW